MKKLLLLLLVAPVLAALFNPLSSAAKINQPRSVTEKTWGTPFKVENGRYYYRINNWVLIEQYNESGIAIATAYYKEGVDFTAAEVADLDKNNPVPTSPLIKLGKNPAWISAWATKDGSFVKQVLVSDKGVRVYSRGYCTAQGVARLSKPAPTPAAPVITERPRPVFQPPPAVSIPRLVAWAKPAIVEIFATRPDGSGCEGTGFFIDRSGMLVTNYHVVKDAVSLQIWMSDGSSLYGTVKAQDSVRDIALIDCAMPVDHWLTLGNTRQMMEGEHILVIGNPKGLYGTVSDGLLAAFRDDSIYHYIQITAPISPGSSGSPVLNERGEVVGVASLYRDDGQNLNFAIDTEVIQALL